MHRDLKRFDDPDLHIRASEALLTLVRNSAGGALSEGSRFLLLTGAAGAGKTHLVVSNLYRHEFPTYSVLIFSPQAHTDFPVWLNRQVCIELLKPAYKGSQATSALADIRSRLFARCGLELQQAIEFFLKRVDLNKKLLRFQQGVSSAADQHFIGRIAKQLVSIFSSSNHLAGLADEFAQAVGIAGRPGARDFCAALILLDSGMSGAAINWLTSGVPPTVLENWDKPSEVPNVLELVLAALQPIRGCLLICFDQLEGLAINPNTAGQVEALTNLIRNTLDLLRKYPNVGCLLSALPEIADLAVNALPYPDQQRIKGQAPSPQNLSLLKLDQIPSFLKRRYEFLASRPSAGEAVKLISDFSNWISVQDQLPMPPRLLLNALERFGHESIVLGLDVDLKTCYERIWMETVAAFEPGQGAEGAIEVVLSNAEGTADPRQVNLKWEHFMSQMPAADPLPENHSQTTNLISWALEHIGPHVFAVESIVGVQRLEWQESPAVSFEVKHSNGSRQSRIFVLAESPFQHGVLKAQLEKILSGATSATVIVGRTVNAFPGGKNIPPLLSKLEVRGGAKLEFTKQELVYLSQLKRFRDSVSPEEWSAWIGGRTASMTPCIEKLVQSL